MKQLIILQDFGLNFEIKYRWELFTLIIYEIYLNFNFI